MSGFYVTTSTNSPVAKKAEYLKSRGSNVFINKNKNISIVKSSNYDSAVYEDAFYTIVCDGNIYDVDKNVSKDCRTTKDFPVELGLAYLYRLLGTDMLKYINGSFSFIIYDKQNHIIFGARDRLGEKPLFYSTSRGFECSSSLRAICCDNKFSVNPKARDMYIKFGFIYDSQCIFNDVNKLPAGHYFTYNIETKSLVIEKYWDIDTPNYKDTPLNISRIEDITSHINFLLVKSIQIRMPEHDKIGIGISSGTDGFTLFGYFNRCGNYPLYNVIPNEAYPFNEYPLAQQHVNEVNPNKKIIAHTMSDEDYFNSVQDYLKYYEEPNSDFSCFITNSLFKRMHNDGIKVAFSGIGSDDIFFAKPYYLPYIDNAHSYRFTYMDLSYLYSYAKFRINDYSNVLDDSNILSMQHYDIKTYLPNLLVKEDIASQCNGVEIRSPFCDYKLVEFMNTLSVDTIYHDNILKYLLKKLILEQFKVNFFDVKKKGFFPDVHRITGIREVKEDILKTINKDSVSFYFPNMNFDKVNDILTNYSVGNNDRILLTLYAYIKMMVGYEKVFN